MNSTSGYPGTVSLTRATSAIAIGLVLLACLVLLSRGTAGAEVRSGQADTVTLRGNVYAFIFGGNVSRLEGAVIRIAEIPGLEATAGPNGAWSMEVPDDTTITPYAELSGPRPPSPRP